jgi:hypothetical protein
VYVYSDAVGIVSTFVVLERIINAYLFNKRTYTHAFKALQYVHAYLRSYIWPGLYFLHFVFGLIRRLRLIHKRIRLVKG